MFTLHNFKADTIETVHQRCVLITGTTHTVIDRVLIKIESRRGSSAALSQPWPVSNGHFKALALLTPGINTISITSSNNDEDKIDLRIRYMPLTKIPPLHLAILIAKDSPLSIDCPPIKFGTFSSTHSSLDAAIAKFRVAALMWQALVAEEMREADLSRRSFRFDEQWAADTLTQEQVQASLTAPKDAMGWVPLVHLVRTSRTVAEIRGMDGAQLQEVFVDALKAYGGPFVSKSKPIVAGLILDSHFDAKRNRVLAHAAMATCESHALSLAMFGSHLTYAWPRFMDEIPGCLLDTRLSCDSVAHEHGRCSSLWEACAVGQRDFLSQVCSAFGAKTEQSTKNDDITKWPKAFLPRTGYCHQNQTDGQAYDPSDPSWHSPPHGSVPGNLRDLLILRASRPHFRLPGDKDIIFSPDPPVVDITGTFEKATVTISSKTGIKYSSLQHPTPPHPPFIKCSDNLWKMPLDKNFITQRLHIAWGIKVLAGNGLETEVRNIWGHLHPATAFIVPGKRGMVIEKKSVGPRDGAPVVGSSSWTVMLRKKNSGGKMVRAKRMALHVGDALDGAVVYYDDGTFATCGIPGTVPGGHQRRSVGLRKGVEVSCVAVTRMGRTWWPLVGLRVWMGDGRGMGALNARHDGGLQTEFLVAGKGRRIIGFFGRHGGQGGLCSEFGIVTASKGVRLPEEVWDPEKWEVLDQDADVVGEDRKRDAEDEGEEEGPRAKRKKVEGSPIVEDDAMELDDGCESSSDGEGSDGVVDDADFGYDDFRRSNEFKELYEGKGYV
ncbi:putative peptidase family-domain-containing protein [Cercophora samala]|uniref:Peptidase family-domain-containing protein n=1 Tax=Cercophora samala TaxID=330535 RepID=A0AA39Z258_9PEZI|nr:putative peptidase family-domain-containing protein [Cercophora samala]